MGSHVGGHKFAGNIIIYGGRGSCAASAFTGDWYGCVTAESVARIVEEHIRDGKVVKDHWRGRMGLTIEQQKELYPKLGCVSCSKESADSAGDDKCGCGAAGIEW